MAANYDLLVVGDDAPGLCAAAAAAKTGAAVLLAPAGAVRVPRSPSICDIPNFVWRRLELQDYGLALEPISARITLLEDGVAATTLRGAAETADALAGDDDDAAALWPALVEDMRALGEDAASLHTERANALSAVADARSLSALGRAAGSTSELLDDYLNGGPLSAHVSAHALSLSGQGGEEAGSAMALPEFFDEHSWRVRSAPGSRSLNGALRRVCEVQGVETAPTPVRDASADGARFNSLNFGDETKRKARRILFATPDAAETAGYKTPGVYNGGRAVLRLVLRREVEPPAGDGNAIFQIVDKSSDLESARNAALDGRLSDRPPVAFEFTDKGDIIAHTSYIPKRLRDDEGWRNWTGQDRQALTKIMIDQLASRIDGLRDRIRKKELVVIAGTKDDARPFARAQHVFVQPKRHNAIAAAVTLVDKVLADE
jgi:phytoene dehydrogenase-like protein